MISKSISRIFQAIIILALALILFGCPSHNEIVRQKIESSASPYIGLSIDDLVRAKGAPDSRTQLSTGEEVWTYKTSKTGEKKGMIVTIGNNNNSRRPITTWTETVNYIIQGEIIESYTVSID